MKNIPLMIDTKASPEHKRVIWVNGDEYRDYINAGFADASIVCMKNEAKWAKLRRQIQRETLEKLVGTNG